MTTNNGFEQVDAFPGGIYLSSDADVTGTCAVTLRSGGNGQNIGLDKVKIGQTVNVTNLTPVTQFKTGTYFIEASELTPLPALWDTEDQQTNGGDTIFRDSSVEETIVNSGGGEVRLITFNYLPETDFPETHFSNNTMWQSVSGGYFYRDFVVGYSEPFVNNFVLFADADWSVTYDGTRNEMGEWVRTNAEISIRNFILPRNEISQINLVSFIGPGGAITPANNISSIRVTGQKLIYQTGYTGFSQLLIGDVKK